MRVLGFEAFKALGSRLLPCCFWKYIVNIMRCGGDDRVRPRLPGEAWGSDLSGIMTQRTSNPGVIRAFNVWLLVFGVQFRLYNT